jgi:hypothetical protein
VRVKVKLSDQLDLLTEEHWRALSPITVPTI